MKGHLLPVVLVRKLVVGSEFWARSQRTGLVSLKDHARRVIEPTWLAKHTLGIRPLFSLLLSTCHGVTQFCQSNTRTRPSRALGSRAGIELEFSSTRRACRWAIQRTTHGRGQAGGLPHCEQAVLQLHRSLGSDYEKYALR